MKTKFNENDVPSWCNWIAVDKNGVCAAFKSKPHHEALGNGLGGYWSLHDNDEGRNCLDLYKGDKPRNWKLELYTWR